MLPSSVRFTYLDTELVQNHSEEEFFFFSFKLVSSFASFPSILRCKIELPPQLKGCLLKSQVLLLGGEDERKAIKAI